MDSKQRAGTLRLFFFGKTSFNGVSTESTDLLFKKTKKLKESSMYSEHELFVLLLIPCLENMLHII